MAFKSAPIFVELSGEEGEGDLPSFGSVFLTIIQKPGLKEAAHVHLLGEVDDSIIVCDGDYMVNTLDLTVIELARKGGDV